jgi:hypothetical protein
MNAAESDVKPQILPPLKEPLGSIASRIFNPPSGAELEAAVDPSQTNVAPLETEPAQSPAVIGAAAAEPHPATKAAPDA